MTANYSDDTEGARVCLERSLDMIRAATGAVPVDSDTFRFLDCGAADGGTALGLWSNVLELALGREGVTRFELLANDLPSNDFDALGINVARTVADRPDALGLMVPRSFYAPVAAPGSVHLGFSATAMHWLSEKPILLRTHTHANATPDVAARNAFAAVAQRDWRRILTRRAEELAPGGELVLVNLARDGDGRFLGRNHEHECMHDVLHDLWKGLREEGRIDEEAYVRGTFQNFYKSEAELTECLTDAASTPHRAGLRLVTSRVELVPCFYRARFAKDGDTDAFADGLMRTVRSWSEHTFRDALGERTDRQAVCDTLYARYRAAIAAAPERHSMDYVQSYLRLRKVAA